MNTFRYLLVGLVTILLAVLAVACINSTMPTPVGTVIPTTVHGGPTVVAVASALPVEFESHKRYGFSITLHKDILPCCPSGWPCADQLRYLSVYCAPGEGPVENDNSGSVHAATPIVTPQGTPAPREITPAPTFVVPTTPAATGTPAPTNTPAPTQDPTHTPAPTQEPTQAPTQAPTREARNCGVGNGVDGDTNGCPDGRNDGEGTGPGHPGAQGGNGNNDNNGGKDKGKGKPVAEASMVGVVLYALAEAAVKAGTLKRKSEFMNVATYPGGTAYYSLEEGVPWMFVYGEGGRHLHSEPFGSRAEAKAWREGNARSIIANAKQ